MAVILKTAWEEITHKLNDLIIEAAGMLGYEQLGQILDQVDMASRRMKSNVQADAVLEVMFLNIRQLYRARR